MKKTESANAEKMKSEENGAAAARKVIADFGASDVFAIAEKSGVKIVRASWFPVTIGEFERNTRTISVNRKALENSANGARLEKMIVAHELGHFYAIELNLNKTEEEIFARAFAEELTKNID